MIKKAALLVGLCLCLSTPAIAADGPYVGVNLGVTVPMDSDVTQFGFTGEVSYDPGFAASAAVGYKMGMGRFEGEVGYKQSDLDRVSILGFPLPSNGDASLFSLMGNGYIDFDVTPVVKPYIMAGLGAAQLTLDMVTEEDDTVFAYQAGFGCGFALNEKVTLDAGYRYMGTSDASLGATEVSYDSHNFLAGVRFAF